MDWEAILLYSGLGAGALYVGAGVQYMTVGGAVYPLVGITYVCIGALILRINIKNIERSTEHKIVEERHKTKQSGLHQLMHAMSKVNNVELIDTTDDGGRLLRQISDEFEKNNNESLR